MAPDQASVPLYLFSFNCGRQLFNPQNISDYIFSALNPVSPLPEIVAISLQEFAPVSYSFIGSSYIAPYLQSWSSVLPLISQNPTSKFPEYVEIGRKHVGMTALFVFTSRPEKVKDISFAGVGFGFLGMGNKGGVAAKIRYSIGGSGSDEEDVNMTLVATHLTAHEQLLQRRNQDWESLVRGTVFETSSKSGSNEGDESTPLLRDTSAAKDIPSLSGIFAPRTHLVIMGDLNYRTSDKAPSPDHAVLFPRSRSDLAEYFKKDQLNIEKQAGNTMHGLIEANVEFGPTYKLRPQRAPKPGQGPDAVTKGNLKIDVETQMWNWAGHRWPSWCDRILYLPLPSSSSAGDAANITIHKYDSIPEISFSDHLPVALHLSLPPIKAHGDDIRSKPPFPIDQNWKSKRESAEAREWFAGYVILTVTTVGGLALVACGAVGVGMLWWTLFGTRA